jgi:hypothetical protein
VHIRRESGASTGFEVVSKDAQEVGNTRAASTQMNRTAIAGVPDKYLVAQG